MKRRDFLRSAGAAAVLPVLPLPALSAPAATAAPVNAMQVGWAALYARVNERVTPALLQKWLRVGPGEAQSLMSELVQRQIISAPVGGSAMAVDPMYAKGKVPGMFKSASRGVEKAREVFDALTEDDPISEEPDATDAEWSEVADTDVDADAVDEAS